MGCLALKEAFYVDNASKSFAGFQTEFSEADFVLFGVPFDSSSSFRPGSRFAPNSLRQLSANLETWSWRTGIDFEDIKMHDLGDLAVVHGDSAETVRRVSETVEDIIATRKIPVMVGGEHMVSLGAVKAIKDVTVVSFDAHFDMRDEYLSNRLSHACVMRRSLEEITSGKVILAGVRATYREEVEMMRKKGIDYLSALEMLRSDANTTARWLKRRLEGAGKIYISIDIDVLDPCYAPGIGNPEPEGISPTYLLDVLNDVVDDRIVGFDVVEVSPPYDNGNTAAVASKIIFELCSMIKLARK